MPYANVIVVATSVGAMTQENGSFVIYGVPAGSATLRITMLECSGQKLVSVTIVPGETFSVTITLDQTQFPRRDGIVSDPHARGKTVYRDDVRAFAMDVPAGWHAAPANYSVMHYRDVFAIVTNGTSGLRVTDKHLSNEWRYSAETVAEQLQAGTMYVDLAHFEGPGGSARYGPGREDSFENELQKFLRAPKPYRETSDLEWYRLDFVKWGSHWDVSVFCKRPYSTDDKQRAFSVLGSLRFHEVPIVNSAQAVGAAFKHVPAEAQPKDTRTDPSESCACCAEEEWLANGGRNGRRETRIDRKDEGFVVKFVLYEDGSSDVVVGTWEYLVRWDGTVEPSQSR